MDPSWSQAKPPPPTAAAAAAQRNQDEQHHASLSAAWSNSPIPDLVASLRAIPRHDKMEYLHALRVAPHLIDSESDPIAFLRFCDWNASAAARRLVMYWRKRTQVFGVARAYLPLLNDFSGNGALGSDELEILRLGGFCLMPPDIHEHSVGYIDRSCIPQRLRQTPDARVRAFFMVVQQMVGNPQTQMNGAVFLIRGMQGSDGHDAARQCAELLHVAFPVRVHASHIIYLRQERVGFMQSVIPFLLQHFGRLLSNKIHVHDCESVEQLLLKISRHGISRDSLPSCMGGFAGTDGTCASSFLDPLSASDLATIAGSVPAGGEQQPQHQEHQLADLDPLSVAQGTAASNPVPGFESSVHPLGDGFGGMGSDGSEGYLFEGKPHRAPPQLDQQSVPPSHPVGVGVGEDYEYSLDGTPIRPPPPPQQHHVPAAPDTFPASLQGTGMMDLVELQGPSFHPSPIMARVPQQQVETNASVRGAAGEAPLVARMPAAENDDGRILGTGHMSLAGPPFDPAPILPRTQELQVTTSPPIQQQQEEATTDSSVPGVDDATALLRYMDNASIPTSVKVPAFEPEDDPFEPRPFRPIRVPTPSSISTRSIEEASRLTGRIPLVETPVMLERSLAALKEAMNAFPVEKEAYAEAVRRAPAVVQTDSDPRMYLRFEKFNSWAAAKSLGLHWKNRVQYFGDRAFLPLAQIRGGALSEEDLQTLKAGPFFFLPADSRNRPVLCCDPSRRPDNTSKESLIRVAMYFFSILLCENPTAVMTDGCLILIFVSTLIMGFDETFREAIDVSLDSFPLKKCETHVICSQEQQSPATMNPRERPFFNFVLPVLQRTVGRLLCLDGMHLHVGTRDELERKLVACGLSGGVLQAAVSGGISNDDFAQWMQKRQLVELHRHGHPNEPPGNQHQPSPSLLPPTVAQGTKAARTTDQNKSPSESRGTMPPANRHVDITVAMELVSPPEKEAYLEAVKKVPDLVRKESDPVVFLKMENYDAAAAAKRLAAYWRIRCEIFGERAYLAMDQTGDGALHRRDVAALQTGFLTQLPNDLSGRSVVCCDGSRVEKPSPSSQLRVFFYLWSVLSQNDLSRTDGYTVLYTTTEPNFDRGCKKCLDLVMEAYPVKLKCFHLLGCSPGGTSKSDFRHGPVEATMNLLLNRSDHEKVVVHICDSRADFASKLVSHGMSKDRLPKAFGGKWGSDDFLQWQELRIRSEWELPIPTSAKKFVESYGIPSSIIPRPSSLNDEEQTERKRRLNVVHSRRKRERARIEVQLWQEQCSTLREERKELLREGRELEGLLESAKAVVDELDS